MGKTRTSFKKRNKASSKFEKLTNLELEQEAYQSYCDHIASGKKSASWYFDHPKLQLTAQTLEKYIKENPAVFCPIKKEVAYAKGYQKWESVCDGSADGSNKAACTPSLQMIMRNKYGWDKPEAEEKSGLGPKFDEFMTLMLKGNDSGR